MQTALQDSSKCKPTDRRHGCSKLSGRPGGLCGPPCSGSRWTGKPGQRGEHEEGTHRHVLSHVTFCWRIKKQQTGEARRGRTDQGDGDLGADLGRHSFRDNRSSSHNCLIKRNREASFLYRTPTPPGDGFSSVSVNSIESRGQHKRALGKFE